MPGFRLGSAGDAHSSQRLNSVDEEPDRRGSVGLGPLIVLGRHLAGSKGVDLLAAIPRFPAIESRAITSQTDTTRRLDDVELGRYS